MFEDRPSIAADRPPARPLERRIVDRGTADGTFGGEKPGPSAAPSEGHRPVAFIK
jgi:hypothetical protein